MASDPARMWDRQEARGDLAEAYWDLARARPGFRIADVGCGPGYFALRHALATGPTGHVHAVDADPSMLAYLAVRLDRVHHPHVTLELLDVTTAPLPDLHFDVIFCSAMLHHVDDVPAALRNLRGSKAPLVIAEFDPEGPGDVGPPKEVRIAPDALASMLRDAGFRPHAPRALRHETYAIRAEP